MLVADGSSPAPLAAELSRQLVSHRFVTPGSSDLAQTVSAELHAGFTRLAVQGGDPEIAAVIGAVLEAGFAGRVDLALLPSRERSELARTFALGDSLAEGVRRLAHGDPYPIDIGVVTGSFGRMAFINSVSTGVLAGGPAWFPFWPRPLRVAGRVVIEGGPTPVETMASGVLVLNGQFWGDWIGAPRSTLVDGVVDLQLFTGTRRQLSRLRPAFRAGMHVRAAGVRRLAVSRAEVDQPPGWQVVVDGIRVGRGPFSVEVVAGAVRLAV